MRKIRIQFCDFWDSFKPDRSFFTRAIEKKFDVEIVKENPDLLVYGVFGNEHNSIKAKTKLAFSQENSFPNFSECDYAISSVKVHVPGRTFYFPAALYYVSSMSLDISTLNEAENPISKELAERKFCCFIYSQAQIGLGAVMRRIFAKKLMEYRHVDCPGRVLHNINVPELSARGSEDWHESKLNYLRKFKFVIAFENTDNVGYISEKLLDAYMTCTVPIYWGSTTDVSPFPRESMICAADYPTLDSLIDKIKEVDTNSEEYVRILKANPLFNPSFVQQLNNKCKEAERFIQDVAESAFKIKPEFQDWHRKSTKSTIKESPIDVDIFSNLMPKIHCINSPIEKIEAENCKQDSMSGTDELKYEINAFLRHIINFNKIFSNQIIDLTNHVVSKEEAKKIFISTNTNRLKIKLLRLRLKKYLVNAKERENIKKQISTIKKIIKDNTKYLKSLYN